MPGVADTEPVTDDESRRLFQLLENRRVGLLAVSGGSDSMALMWLVARWARETAWLGQLHVAVVDHGLRPEAVDEARFVEHKANLLGLACHKLKWHGPYPATGIPAAAREARYDLLFDLAKKLDAMLLVGHTQDDQAETVLMRLARGSGVDGLSAMEAFTVRGGVELVRPLLDVSRQRLRATLKQVGMGWIDDPTNQNLAHERVRLREALAVLDDYGITQQAIARSARRLSSARSALDVATLDLIQNAVTIKANAFALMSLQTWMDVSKELQVRLVIELVRTFGGGGEISLSGAEAIAQWLCKGKGRARTFAGCMFVKRRHEFLVGREPARVTELPSIIQPGETMRKWDTRYDISWPITEQEGKISVLQWTNKTADFPRPADIPAFVWEGLPVVTDRAGNRHVPGDCDKKNVFRLSRPLYMAKS